MKLCLVSETKLAFFDNNFEHVRDLESAHSCVFPLLNTADMFSRANFILMVFLPAFVSRVSGEE